VKAPLPLLTGTDLVIVSPTTVRIATASFTSGDIGKLVRVVGSHGGRNDGTFAIGEVPNSVTAVLRDANFDTADYQSTLSMVVALANSLKTAYNHHLSNVDARVEFPSLTHANNDAMNAASAVAADDLPTAVALLNDVKACFAAHAANSGGDFHLRPDVWNDVTCAQANDLSSALVLANQLRQKYEAHRLERRSHHLGDIANKVSSDVAVVVRQTAPGTLVGPFVWTILDPMLGMVADSPQDVVVRINGSVVDAEAVFGMFGAVVLPSKPSSGDTVNIDYRYLNNPPARFQRLNSPEFVLNQDKNNGIMGLPSHRYRARSYLVDPGHTPDLISAVSPLRVGWKYKAFERRYSASSNDPSKLLLNSPINKLKYPVFNTVIRETTLSWDANVLPQNATDPWTLQGLGLVQLSNNLLTLVDDDLQSTASSKPPFFTHASDIVVDSVVSAAFRASVSEYLPDGVFTGVGFGLSDGYSVALVGFVKTDATNLSSAIVMANSLKSNFNAHLVHPTVHNPNDPADSTYLVDAKDLQSLVILLNALKLKHNLHLAKADPSLSTAGVHKAVDSAHMVAAADADDLASAVSLANAMRTAFNAHLTSPGVHFVNDAFHAVEQVRQVGVLTNSGPHEFQESWEAGAADWTSLKTYRLSRDAAGNVQLHMSGDVLPLVTVTKNRLPAISDFEGKFDPVQQVFFGSISREATSRSHWSLVRANITPLDSNLLEDNKTVWLDGSVTPELDTLNPWITLGHGGVERAVAGSWIQVESTSSANVAELVTMGASSGAFRGYMRFEPMLSPNTSSVVEFTASIEYHTFSVGNRSHGLYMDDGQQSVHFAFLYHNPTPASVTGSVAEPFVILPTDKLVIGFDGAPQRVVSFEPPVTVPPTPPPTTAAQVCGVINAAVGFSLASPTSLGHVRLTYGSGVSSYMTITGGSSAFNAAARLGIQAGKYFGTDSNPEPRISWFGENPPDAELVPWMKSGGSPVSMLGSAQAPVMRISDSSTSDYAAFTMSNKLVSVGTLSPSSEWKVDVRFSIDSFTPGDSVLASAPFADLRFCGALLNVDEGYGGKNVELHCAVDANDNPYLNLVTYMVGTDSLEPVAQYAFAWNDGEQHSYNIFKNKVADQLFVYADGTLLVPAVGSPTYAALGDATGSIPSMSFGSGAESVTNSDMRTAVSVVDWSSVCAFKDSKLNDPEAPSRRYVGIYKGGNPSAMSSWALTGVDWSSPHTYRIVRDPIGPVALYIDGEDTPSISMSYSPTSLPPSLASFMRGITNNRPVIAWGALDSLEISRGRWTNLRYSLGRHSLTDRLVPPRHVLNQANLMASPEHLRTPEQHNHWGYSVYSGGTPDDSFMAASAVQAFTVLGEGVPPVPKTQDLESRGGLVKVATPASSVSAADFMNYRGYLGNYEDDSANAVGAAPARSFAETLAQVVSAANALCAAYEGHRVRHDVSANVHVADDAVNVIASPLALDLATAVARLSEFKTVFNSHISDATCHDTIDADNLLTEALPFDLDSCVALANEALVKYSAHLASGCFHFVPDVFPHFDTSQETTADATDATSCRTLLTGLRDKFVAHAASSFWHAKKAQYSVTLNHSSIIPLANQLMALLSQHRVAPGVHQFDDKAHLAAFARAVDLGSCIALANAAKAAYNDHVWNAAAVGREPGHRVHLILARVGGALADAVSTNPIEHQLAAALHLAQDIKAKFNCHVSRDVSHVETDSANLVQLSADGLASLVSLANALKASFNRHRTTEVRTCKVHIQDDVANVVTASDATDLDSACALLNQLASSYDAHRTYSGVHGSAAFIRLEPPPRVLYESMRFWQSSTGTAGLVHPFSDDETWHVDAVNSQSNKSVTYDGTNLPEQAIVVSVGSRPSALIDGDTLVLEVDKQPPVTVVFERPDASLNGVVDKINTVVPRLASVQNAEIRLSSPAPGSSSSVFVNGGSARRKLGFEVPQSSPWFVASENPSDVTIEMIPAEGCLRYGVSGQSSTIYSNRVGYPAMPSSGMCLSARLRINSPGSSIDGDSGIYVGVSCAAGDPGFVMAIGWGGESAESRYIKLHDAVSGRTLDRIPMDWLDGQFHTYSLTYDEAAGTVQLAVV
jgi:hypothetical protein